MWAPKATFQGSIEGLEFIGNYNQPIKVERRFKGKIDVFWIVGSCKSTTRGWHISGNWWWEDQEKKIQGTQMDTDKHFWWSRRKIYLLNRMTKKQ